MSVYRSVRAKTAGDQQFASRTLKVIKRLVIQPLFLWQESAIKKAPLAGRLIQQVDR